MLIRNGKEIKDIYVNGKKVLKVYNQEKLLYDSRIERKVIEGKDIKIDDCISKYTGKLEIFGNSEQGTQPSIEYPSEIKSCGDNGSINIIVNNNNETNYQLEQIIIPIQQSLRKIGEYEDTFVKENGKWYEKHCIARKIFDGTEEWSHSGVTNNKRRFRLGIDDMKPSPYVGNKAEIISNYFKTVTAVQTWNCEIGISGIIEGQSGVYILDDIHSLAEEFKTWLAEKYNEGNPVYVDYVLQMPELIECTEEQIQVLEYLRKIKMYEQTTYISSTDEIKPTLKCTYKKYKEV